MDIRVVVTREMRGQALTANRLAKLAGVPSRTVYDFIDGKSPINSDALGRIADVLGLRLLPAAELRREAELLAETKRIQGAKILQIPDDDLAAENAVLRKALTVLARENRTAFAQVAEKIGPDPDPSLDVFSGRRAHVIVAQLMRRAKASRKGESDSTS